MRQRLLNGALVGALAAVFCLLSATAYAEVEKGDSSATCTSENRTIDGQAAKRAICMAMKCGTRGTTANNCRKEATAILYCRRQASQPNQNRIEKLPQRKMRLKQ